MKLAEALAKRSDLNQQIHELDHRLLRCVQIQVGDNPPEDPEALLSVIERSFAELQQLVDAIDRTNAASILEGRPLSSWLSERNRLKEHRIILLRVIERASVSQMRISKSEVRFISTISAARLQKQADDLAKAFREIDLKIQAANWNFDLITTDQAGADTENGITADDDATE